MWNSFYIHKNINFFFFFLMSWFILRNNGFKLFNLFFFIFYFFYFLFLAVLGLCLRARAFSSCSERGPLFIAVHRSLTIAASLVAEHRLQTRRLSSCGSRAQLLGDMWDLPRPGPEPMSPALAGRLPTTAPPRKPKNINFLSFIDEVLIDTYVKSIIHFVA